jgi:hypothetical protein
MRRKIYRIVSINIQAYTFQLIMQRQPVSHAIVVPNQARYRPTKSVVY